MINPDTIRSLVLFNGGNSGGVITYGIIEGDDKKFNNQISKINHAPIPIEMEVVVDKLKIHALRICEIFTRSADQYYDFKGNEVFTSKSGDISSRVQNMLYKCWISKVDFKENGFGISFTYERFDGVMMKYSTDIINPNSNYDYYNEVMDILRELTPIAFEWIHLRLLPSDARVEYSVIAAQKKIHNPMDVKNILDGMSSEDRRKNAIEYLEKSGNIIISPEEALPHQNEEKEDNVEEAFIEDHLDKGPIPNIAEIKIAVKEEDEEKMIDTNTDEEPAIAEIKEIEEKSVEDQLVEEETAEAIADLKEDDGQEDASNQDSSDIPEENSDDIVIPKVEGIA